MRTFAQDLLQEYLTQPCRGARGNVSILVNTLLVNATIHGSAHDPSPTPTERVSRARADLRMGVPVVIASGEAGLCGLGRRNGGRQRVAALRALGRSRSGDHARRAETLKARAYDGDLARIAMPEEADATWLADIATPRDDLMAPMKGPLQTLRDGDATLHRARDPLAKSAQLLPRVLAVGIGDAAGFA
jgi:GTP cyclohydrolase II